MGKESIEIFQKLKWKISQAPVLTCLNFHNPSEVDIDASRYAIGLILMEGGKLVCYHYDIFHGRVLNYPTYDKEFYALVQPIKRWKHYLKGKETIIHIDH
jgi:hypothetical protein